MTQPIEALVREYLDEQVVVVREELLRLLAERIDASNLDAVIAVLEADPATTELDRSMLLRELTPKRIPRARTYALELRARFHDPDALEDLDEVLRFQVGPRPDEWPPRGPGVPFRIRIEGQPVAPEDVTYRDIGFGRTGPHEEVVGYELEAPSEALLSTLEPYYQGYPEDDRLFAPDEDDPVLLRLRTAGWPPLVTLARTQPALAAGFVEEWATMEVMQSLFPPGRKSGSRYILNGLRGVVVGADSVSFSGQAIRRG